MIKDTVCLPENMDTGSILVLAILGGGFILGVWFILIRRDARLKCAKAWLLMAYEHLLRAQVSRALAPSLSES